MPARALRACRASRISETSASRARKIESGRTIERKHYATYRYRPDGLGEEHGPRWRRRVRSIAISRLGERFDAARRRQPLYSRVVRPARRHSRAGHREMPHEPLCRAIIILVDITIYAAGNTGRYHAHASAESRRSQGGRFLSTSIDALHDRMMLLPPVSTFAPHAARRAMTPRASMMNIWRRHGRDSFHVIGRLSKRLLILGGRARRLALKTHGRIRPRILISNCFKVTEMIA